LGATEVGPSARDYGVVYLSIDWAFRKQDQQFIATEFAAHGHPVVYVENTGARLPGLADVPRVADRLRNWLRGEVVDTAPVPDGMTVVSPLCIPGASYRVERALNRWSLRRQMRRAVDALGDRPTILWIGLPTWTSLDVADWLAPRLVVYYCGDAVTRLPGLRRGIVESERAVARRADVVFAASAALVEHCREMGAQAMPVPMSIDFGASRLAREGRTPIPRELVGLRGRLIGYMGGLNAKVDVELLDVVVRAFPNDTLVVLGSVEHPRYRPRSRDVVILGERPYDQIAGYLVRFDVCLIPYVLDRFTEAVNPGKLLEYLAVGRRVVSTPLPEVLPFAPLVRIATTHEEFVAAVDEALRAGNAPHDREERVRLAEEHSFGRVTAGLIDIVDRRLDAGVRGGP
jgi:glycosyltransferase involved in cell wall biosynthesis